MDKRFWGFLVVVAIVLSGVFYFANTHKAAAPGITTKGTLTNHVEGSSPKGVKLVEYGDFQCPACAAYFDAVKQTAAAYNTTVVFQFRNFPLYQIHPNAIAGARAAEAADMQGKYWEMHDRLYTENIQSINASQSGKTYNSWTSVSDPQAAFDSYAQDLGLDLKKFDADYKSSTVNDRVQADLAEGNKLGVDSTPTFFLDGKKISNPQPTLAAFSKVLNAEILKKGGTPPAATPAAEPSATPAQQ